MSLAKHTAWSNEHILFSNTTGMETKHIPESTEGRIEDRYVCQQCSVHMTPEEAVSIVRAHGTPDEQTVYECKHCYKENTDAQG